MWGVHPKLRNINSHNITHSIISRNPTRERMFVVQILLLIITSLSLLYHGFLSLMQANKEVNHTLTLCHVSICGLSPSSSFSYATCWMLVHASTTLPRKAKWSGPYQRRWKENEFKFHSVTCYTNLWYHTSMLTLQISVISRALYLPHVWYYGVYSVVAWYVPMLDCN